MHPVPEPVTAVISGRLPSAGVHSRSRAAKAQRLQRAKIPLARPFGFPPYSFRMPSLKQIIEALVFASQKPLAPREIAAALKSAAEDADDTEAKAFGKTREAEVAALLEELKIEYTGLQRSFDLIEQVNGWQFVTEPAYARWVRQLYPESKPVRLSGPALETLAIIAYRQPITRADIEAVRGVAVDGVVNMLLERQLIRIAGRAEVPGRPLLYETTQFFLEHFGLKHLDELPNVAELRRTSLPSAPAPAPVPAPSAPAAATAPSAPSVAASSGHGAEPAPPFATAIAASNEPAAAHAPQGASPGHPAPSDFNP